MTHPDILAYENEQVNADLEVPRVGDTVAVSSLITEGKKQRIQKFQGIVIKVQGKASRLSITVRKIIDKISGNQPIIQKTQGLYFSKFNKPISIITAGIQACMYVHVCN